MCLRNYQFGVHLFFHFCAIFGKIDHCDPVLVCIHLLCFCGMNNSFTCLVKSKSVKQEVSHTVILPLWSVFSGWILKILFSCRHSSVDSSAPSILQHPDSNPKHTTYAFINLNLNLSCDMLKRRK